jgi:hypothetical protein
MPRFAKAALSAALLSFVVQPASLILADPPAPASDSKPVSHGTNGNNSVRHALNHPLPPVKFDGTPFSDVMEFLADATSSNFSVDWKALDAAHVAKDTPITLRMNSDVPLRKVLSMVLDQAAGAGVLTFYTDEGVIEITSQEASDKVLYSRIYPIQDLLFQPQDFTDAPQLSLQTAGQGQTAGGGGGGATQGQGLFNNTTSTNSTDQKNSQTDRANEIIKLITDTVKPELWQINGGTATISFFRGNLIVNAPRSIHQLLESE